MSRVRVGNPAGITAKLREGLAHQRAGRLPEAEAVYRRILTVQPGHADAWHLLGLIAHRLGKLDAAEAMIAKSVALNPDSATYRANLGLVLRRLGRLEEALDAYLKAREIEGDLVEVHYNLGNLYKDLGRLDEAEAALREAVARKPDFAPAHNTLGITLARRGRLDDAVAAYRAAIAARPGFADAHSNIASALKRLGRTDEAIAAYRAALAAKPGYAEAAYNLGNTYKDLGRTDEAVEAYRTALVAKPDFALAYNNLGIVLAELGRTDEALAAYRAAAERQPGFAEPHSNIGNLLREAGRTDEALVAYRAALDADPDFAVAHNNLGNTLLERGDIDGARAAYRAAIGAKSDFAEAYRNLSTLEGFAPDGSDIDAMTRLIENAATPRDSLVYLRYARARAFHDRGAFDEAFADYLAGGALKREEIDFDLNAQAGLYRRIAATFDDALLARFSDAGEQSELPVFVVGIPRSGTSLVEQILASHPMVHGGGELDDLGTIIDKLPESLASSKPYPDCIADANAETLRGLGARYVAGLRTRAPAAARITDKMPANTRHIGLIRCLMPGARIVHCRRDPLDTCLSCFTTLFTTGHDFSYDLAELGGYYRAYDRLMTHWRALLPDMLEIDYEDVVADLEGQARRLVDFCGLDWDDGCLEFDKTERIVKTASSAQVRRPIYGDSVARWKRYQAHLGPLFEALGPDLVRAPG